MEKYRDYGGGNWSIITPKMRNPDKDDLNFRANRGEFSLRSQEAFEKHERRCKENVVFHKNDNGEFLKNVLREESLWYGSVGMQRLKR